MTRRNLILKARQKGISKIIDANQFIRCLRRSTNAVVISHEREATKRLFASIRYFIDNMEVKPTLSIDSKQEIKFPKTNSNYFIGTAGAKAFGRGDTIDMAHLSEAAFYDSLVKILAGVTEAAEMGQIDLETTPNGREEFYDMWQKAKAGLSPYTCIFIPWFIDDEYSVDNLTREEIQGLSKAVKEMFGIPDEELKKQYTDDEKKLIKRVKIEYGFELTPGQIKWRRYKIWDKGDLFWQEYPEDDVSCFLQSGRSVFNNITTDISKRIPIDDERKFEVWLNDRFETDEEKTKFKKTVLYAGVDGAEGVADGDRHCFSVIWVDVENSIAYVIYEYVSTEPIDVFWLKIGPIIKRFNMALGIEKNGIGAAHCKEASKMGIRHKAWVTSGTNRPTIITDLESAYRKEELIETYPEAEDEARNMVYNKSNRPDVPSGKHDDRVFSRIVAWQMRSLPIPRVTSI